MANPLLSRAGLLLYRQLPEEYRYRDTDPGPGELGDLEAYLHGHGALLDLMRNTLEQLYADGFAEPVDAGGPTPVTRQIQPWLLPYLAELVGADLKAPDPEARTRELARSVGWYKAKGTVGAIDSIADVVANAEAYIVEGWQRTLITPRQALTPFTMDPADVGDGDPMGPPAMPLGTVDIRRFNRAVLDPAGGNSLMTLCLPRRDARGGPLPIRDALGLCISPLFWRQSARTGAPCFPGAFDDSALRTPDLRDSARAADVGPNPRRILAYVQPPYGFFAPGLLRLTAGAGDPLGLATATDPIGARDAAEVAEYLHGRELITGCYVPKLVTLRMADNARARALTYVADRSHYQYAGKLSDDAIAHVVHDAVGANGSNRDYLRNTVQHLEEMGIADCSLHCILKLVEQIG